MSVLQDLSVVSKGHFKHSQHYLDAVIAKDRKFGSYEM